MPSLVVAGAVHVCNSHQLSVGDFEQLLQQILSAGAHANHANSDAIVCAKHARWGSEQRSRSTCRGFNELTPCAIGHIWTPVAAIVLRSLSRRFSPTAERSSRTTRA